MKVKWIILILFLIPLPRAVHAISCIQFLDTIYRAATTICRDAELVDVRADDYCTRIVYGGTDIQKCEFNTANTLCTPRSGAASQACPSLRARGFCTGECPEAGIYEPEPVAPTFTPVLPRLQIPLPTLQPFTSPLKTTTPEGKTILNIDFLAQYIVALYKYLVGIGSIVAGIMYVWAGVKWLTSGGNPEGIGDAKKKIAGASVGLVLLLGSYVILSLVNPELVLFKPLRVEFVDPQLLEDFEGKDLETETIVPATSIGDTTYDGIFQRFANCIPADWRFLKAIAYKESGLNTNKVNPSNYIGLFQTKQTNCESALRGYPQHQSQCANLTNPAVNTAVGALMMRSALQSIRGTCSSAGTLEKLTMVYINHNMGPGVLRYAMDEGCTLPELRQGSINYYTSNDRGKRTAQNYATKYQSACLQSGNTAAQCTAEPKFDYAVSTARATQGLGVSQIDAPATGPCPLDSAQPF